MNNVRTNETDRLVGELDRNFLPAWNGLPWTDSYARRALECAVEEVLKGRREFDAQKFFIVTFGAVKSGKSTLVNALARAEASPTAFARECTMRTSVVMRDTKDRIEQYFAKNVAAEDGDEDSSRRRLCFDLVMDHLRGVVSKEMLEDRVRWEDHPLNKANVAKYLSEQVPEHPLITVVRTSGDGEVLANDVAILDLPGLDGANAGVEGNIVEDLRFRAVVRADLFIFLQSSFSPINRLTGEFLKELYDRSKRPPVWLIQNKIEAKPWLTEEETAEEAREQLREALRNAAGYLGISQQAVRTQSVNLGMAAANLVEGRDPDGELYEKSGFEELERHLVKTLREERAEIQEKNRVGYFDEARQEALKRLKKAEKQITDHENEYNRKREKLANVRDMLNGKNEVGSALVYGDRGAAVTKLRNMVLTPVLQTEDRQGISEVIAYQLDSLAQSSSKIRAKDFNRALEQKAAELPGILVARFYPDGGPKHGAIKAAVESHCEESEEEPVAAASSRLEEVGERPLPKPPVIVMDEIPSLDEGVLQWRQYKMEKGLVGLKKHDAAAVKEQLTKCKEAFRKEFKRRVEQWFATVTGNFWNGFEEQRRQTFLDHVGRVQKRHEQTFAEERQRIDRARKIVDRLKSDLEQIGMLAKQASESMRW